jgi:hypothetical protein
MQLFLILKGMELMFYKTYGYIYTILVSYYVILKIEQSE